MRVVTGSSGERVLAKGEYDPVTERFTCCDSRVCRCVVEQWYGHAAHLIVGHECRFHLATRIETKAGEEVLVSTVGEYFPGEGTREILAKSRGVVLEGRGDAREYDYMKKIGFEEIGAGRLFETMVFRMTDQRCNSSECGCGLPKIIPRELDFAGYNTAGDASRGHMAMIAKWRGREEKIGQSEED